MVDSPCKLVILLSGGGTNLQAFIEAVANQTLNAQIAAVISNKPDAYGLHRAQSAGLVTQVVDHTEFDSRETFDQALAETIETYCPDLLILAGFMRILTPMFVSRFKGKIMNIHPSLLPKYPGLHTHRRAIEAGDKESGASVHFVTSELDGGPVIIQAGVPIVSGDDEEILAQRVLEREHIIYPMASQWFAEGRLQLKDDKVVLDDSILPKQGYRLP